MYFIGLDVHKKSISYCVKDAAGRRCDGFQNLGHITAYPEVAAEYPAGAQAGSFLEGFADIQPGKLGG